MTFFSILFALLIEQLRPLRADNPGYFAIKQLARRMENWFNAGEASHGRLAWLATVMMLTLPTLLLYWICLRLSPLLALVFNVAILYLTLGFRHYSHYFTSIQLALNNGDEVTARRILAEWTKQDTTALEPNEIARIAVETALVTSHRNVFGVFFWFLLPIGPAGAVLYRLAEYLSRAWSEPDYLRDEAFGHFAVKAFYWIDWIPARLTAVAFAIVGNFEDAIYAWRNFARRWHNETAGIILSAGGGAMGVRLGAAAEVAITPVPADANAIDPPVVETESLPGEEPSARSLQAAVGLIWRALLLWMLVLLLFSAATWLT
jgi:adenosylcobinamide-phosphate synthase